MTSGSTGPTGTFPRGVVVRTDAGTVHHSGGGGGGNRGSDRFTSWDAVLAPTLPDAATRLGLSAVAPGAEGHATAVLDGWPATPVPGPVTLGPPEIGNPDCPACGPPPPLPEQPPTTVALDWAIPAPPPPAPQPLRDDRRCAGPDGPGWTRCTLPGDGRPRHRRTAWCR